MDRQLKQRVVGAGLLVALGVIFIPIFLDNGGVDSPVPPSMDIPPAPTEDVSKRAPALDDDAMDEMAARAEEDVEQPPSRVQAGEGANEAPATIAPAPEAGSEVETLAEGVDAGVAPVPEAPRMAPPEARPAAAPKSEPAPPVSKPAAPKPAAGAAPKAEPKPSAKPAPRTEAKTEAKPETRPTSKLESKPEPKPAAAPPTGKAPEARTVEAKPPEAKVPAVTGWSVQLGSFASDANARKLVDKLRAAGYKAYTEARVEQGATVYKVRVGPSPTRTEAERARQRIEGQFDQRGMLVPAH